MYMSMHAQTYSYQPSESVSVVHVYIVSGMNTVLDNQLGDANPIFLCFCV